MFTCQSTHIFQCHGDSVADCKLLFRDVSCRDVTWYCSFLLFHWILKMRFAALHHNNTSTKSALSLTPYMKSVTRDIRRSWVCRVERHLSFKVLEKKNYFFLAFYRLLILKNWLSYKKEQILYKIFPKNVQGETFSNAVSHFLNWLCNICYSCWSFVVLHCSPLVPLFF